MGFTSMTVQISAPIMHAVVIFEDNISLRDF